MARKESPCRQRLTSGGMDAASERTRPQRKPIYPATRTQHPPKEKKSPCGFGSLGVNGWKRCFFEVLNPAFPAALMSTNGSSASTAWLICVQHSVRSYPLLFGGATLSLKPCAPVINLIGPPSTPATSGPTTRASV